MGVMPSPVVSDPSALLRRALFRYPPFRTPELWNSGGPWTPEPVRGDGARDDGVGISFDRRAFPILPRQGEVAPQVTEGEDTQRR